MSRAERGSQAEAEWRVAATARHATYLERVVDGGEEPPVLALLTSDAVRIPGGLVIPARAADLPFRDVRPGLPARVDGSRVQIGPTVFEGGTPVRAPLPTVATPSAARARAAELAAVVDRVAAPVPATVVDHLAELRGAVAGGRPGAPAAAVRRLLGRGPGLTPSGDDLVCGLLVTWSALGERGPAGAARDEVVRVVRTEARRRTTTVSAGLLWQATRGACVPELAALVSALGARGELEPVARRLCAVGHHSGSDLMRGVLAALTTPPGTDGDRARRTTTTAPAVSYRAGFSASADSDPVARPVGA